MFSTVDNEITQGDSERTWTIQVICPERNKSETLLGDKDIVFALENEDEFIKNPEITILRDTDNVKKTQKVPFENLKFSEDNKISKDTMVCSKCRQSFKTKSNLQQHLKGECGKDIHYSCPVGSDSEVLLSDKDIVLSLQADKEFIDNPEITILNEDIVDVQDTQNLQFKSIDSEETFEIIETDLYICPKCQKSFSTKRNLQRHLKAECNKSFEFKEPEKKDSKILLTEDFILTLNKCKDYGKITDTTILQEDDSFNPKLEKCTFYDLTGSDNIELIQADMYVCPKCQKSYNAKRNLQRHLKVECGKEPQYSCPHCTYKNYRRNEISNHIRKRHGPQLFS